VGFFQAVRAAIAKNTASSGGKSAAERELAIQQLVSQAVVSTGIIDIMQAAGIESPDISILSDDFLAEVREMDKKNLALEALRKLINGEVRAQSKRNVTQARIFSERLESAIGRYHTNALTTVQVLEELLQLAKDIKEARQRGDETGLSDEEIAFYDALADNQSARELMGEPALRVIAHELLEAIRANVTVDWMHRNSARANIRRHVKRILRRYGYPPDLQEAAVRNVLQQAEALSAQLAS
jgi:type I restriction enzyme R subunit